MFEKGKKYMIATALIVLLTAGLATAIRPGITIPLDVTYSNAQIPIETATTTTTLQTAPQIIGGQTDTHGCLAPAGFVWNTTANACMRPWNGDIQLSAGTMMVDTSDPNWRQKLALSVPISTSIKCIDSDKGKDYYTAGKVFVLGKTPKIDTCLKHRIVKEWYCDGDNAKGIYVMCKKGCNNGACLPETIATSTTTSTATTIPALL